jgi:hypothetical protein
MHPKIDPQQALPAAGAQIGGPIGPWDPDETAAIFTFMVTQIVGNGVAIGMGKSDIYHHGAGGWWAPVEVLQNRPAFRAGGATVMAWASIALDDGGWKMYPWGRPVELSSP